MKKQMAFHSLNKEDSIPSYSYFTFVFWILFIYTWPSFANDLYVINSSDNTVSVIESTSGTVVETITVGDNPQGIVITPNGRYAYVTNNSGNSISVISITSREVITTIVDDFSGPLAPAITPNGRFVYVPNNGNNTISVIDTRTNTVSETIEVGTWPVQAATTPDGSHIYVTNSNSDTVSVIHTATNTVIETIEVGSFPFGVTVDSSGIAYVSNLMGNSVSFIDTTNNSVTTTVSTGYTPRYLALTPDETYLYVTISDENNVTLINVQDQSSSTIATGDYPFDVTFLPNGTGAYVSNAVSNNVSIIDTSSLTVIASVEVGQAPQAMAIVPDPVVVLPPASLIAERKTNVFPFQRQFLNVLTWTPSSSFNIKAYNIYRNDILIASIASDKPLIYKDYLIDRNESYTYALTALNEDEVESESRSFSL